MAPKLAPQGDIASAFANLSIGAPKGMQETLDGCPPRPGYGAAGKEIKVNANMYMARFKNQSLSVNTLCYSFARVTRSVSMVPVTYYADFVAERSGRSSLTMSLTLPPSLRPLLVPRFSR
ncbi:hypothetical protein IAR50_005689 [Cryptococcus sp. DSM 104548]